MNPKPDRPEPDVAPAAVGSHCGPRATALMTSCLVLLALPLAGLAQPTEQGEEEEDVVEEIVVVGSQVRLTRAYPGGQVARGGRAGLLGNLDFMDTPFTSTNFTAELMADQQARSVSDVLQNDPVVRVARGFGNFQEL